jgi:adenylate cyclase class IV
VPRNIELKVRVSELASARARVMALTSRPPDILRQVDTFLAVPTGRLKVREFEDGSGELIAYERPDQQGPKESAYTRVHCLDARMLAQALAGVLPVCGTVSKQREVFIVGRTRVHLDEVSRLGCFVELEVILEPGEAAEHGRAEALELLRRLGISGEDLLAGSYVDLLGRSATAAVAAGGTSERDHAR